MIRLPEIAVVGKPQVSVSEEEIHLIDEEERRCFVIHILHIKHSFA